MSPPSLNVCLLALLMASAIAAEPLAGRGFRPLGGDVERRLAVVPRTYACETDIRQYGLRQFCAVLADGWLTIAAPEGSSIALSDTRCFYGQDIRIDAASSVPWLPQAVAHPAGSIPPRGVPHASHPDPACAGLCCNPLSRRSRRPTPGG